MDSPFTVFIVGCCKLIAVSFTVAGGLRGGKFALHHCVIFRASRPIFLSFFLTHIAVMAFLFYPVVSLLTIGYIFPLMCSGSAFGRLLYYVLPETIPLQIVVLSTAAAMNVAITRTSLATTLILAFLPGEPMALPPILMASLCSLFATSYMVSEEKVTRQYALTLSYLDNLDDSRLFPFLSLLRPSRPLLSHK